LAQEPQALPPTRPQPLPPTASLLAAMFSLAVAASAMAEVAACSARPRPKEEALEEALRALLLDPRVLSEVLLRHVVDDTTPVWVLSLRLGRAVLAPELAGSRLEMHVKYGEKGRSMHRATVEVQSSEGSDEQEPTVDFDTAIAFLWQPQLAPVIRLRLVQLGVVDRAVAKAEFEVPSPGTCGHYAAGGGAEEISLFERKGAQGECLGTVFASLEVRAVPRAELCALGPLPGLPALAAAGALASSATAGAAAGVAPPTAATAPPAALPRGGRMARAVLGGA